MQRRCWVIWRHDLHSWRGRNAVSSTTSEVPQRCIRFQRPAMHTYHGVIPTSSHPRTPWNHPLASSLDKTDGQVSRIGGHFLFQRDQLIHVPLRPHKSSIKELCLWDSKPNTAVARQFLWKIASSAPVRTTISLHRAIITYHLPKRPSHSGRYQ